MTDKDTIEETSEESTQFTVVDDPSEKTVSDDDELDKYTKNVSKRINNLNKREYHWKNKECLHLQLTELPQW